MYISYLSPTQAITWFLTMCMIVAFLVRDK